MSEKITARQMQDATLDRCSEINVKYILEVIERYLKNYLSDENQYNFELTVPFPFRIPFTMIQDVKKEYCSRGFKVSYKEHPLVTDITLNWRVRYDL